MYESQRLEPLAGSTGLLALVHTTRLTGGYDCKAPRIKSNIPVGEPAVIEILVKAFFRQKLLMGALFNDGAMVHHENQGGVPDGRKACGR